MSNDPVLLDLDAYFRRIGYTGPRAPTLAVLRDIQRLHPAAIPFENLNPLTGVEVRIDLASVQQKLVHSRRGGYCFEHNTLLQHVLAALGFRVCGLAARVLWNQPEDAVTMRSHMLLRVTIDGEDYMADVGFGGQTPTGPLRLVDDIEQATPLEPFRLVQAGTYRLLQARIEGEWKTLYRFDLVEHFPVDYAVANYYLWTNPASHFTSSLTAARSRPEGRWALSGRRLNVHRLNGDSERRELESADEIVAVLDEVFGIAVPDRAAFDAALARINLF
jgi:N-hydroxyarylamine O-acetyltransferase